MRFIVCALLVCSLPVLAQEAPATGAAEQPAAEQPPAEQPPAEQPAAEQPAAEQPAAEQPPAEGTSTDDGAVTETPPASTEGTDAEEGATPVETTAPVEGGDQGAGETGAGTATPEASAAPADAPRILFLGVTNKGAPEAVVDEVQQTMTKQAQESFVGETVTREQLKLLLEASAQQAALGCDAEACMTDVGQLVDASRVMSANVALAGADLLITVLIVEPSTGKLLSSEQRKTPAEADLYNYAARNLVALALTGAPANPRVPVTIGVKADEPGARLIVDGSDVGEAPQTVLLDPGNHKLEATLPGYAPTTQTFTVQEATPLSLEVELFWERFPLWPVAATLGVFSGITLIAGTVLFAVSYYNYDGIASLLGSDHSYQGHTPATSSTLAATGQNVLLWGWAGQILVFGGLAIGAAAVAFEVGDIVWWSFQSAQGSE